MDKMGSCRWCHKLIKEENLSLHEMHCKRFLSLCPDCGQTVPTEQLEEHREEEHSLVCCPKCNEEMERCQLEDHEESECVERLQVCDFCELQLPFKALANHRVACGSRTELCPACGRYVLLRESQNHASSCSASRKQPRLPAQAMSRMRPTSHKLPVSCMVCKKPIPEQQIYEHEIRCLEASQQKAVDTSRQEVARLQPPRTGTGLQDQDQDQVGTCPHCDLALPLSTLRWHQTKCQTFVLLQQMEEQ